MRAVLAGFAAAAVVLQVVPRRGFVRRVRLPPEVVVALLIAGAGLAVGLTLRVPVLLIVLAGAGLAAWLRQLRRNRATAVAARRSRYVVTTCEGLAAELTSGRPPVTALDAVAADWPEFATAARAARLGADVPAALRELARLPGAHELRHVAAAWTVAHRSGAGLAGAIGLAARMVRENAELGRTIATELAAARATARLLAVLPLGVLLIGRGTGGDPFAFLFGTTPGLVCLGTGLGLAWAGALWLEQIADAVRRS
ncbi:MAG: type secretion system protein [Marmoricola sp.]|nr:type secretion system protein [Marmoricola sp.]